jgi:hypothetical protein
LNHTDHAKEKDKTDKIPNVNKSDNMKNYPTFGFSNKKNLPLIVSPIYRHRYNRLLKKYKLVAFESCSHLKMKTDNEQTL